MKTLFVTMVLGCMTGLRLLAQTPQLVWAKSFGNQSALTKQHAMTTDSQGNIYMTGYFDYSKKLDFDLGPDSLFLDYMQGNRYIAKYNRDGNLLWAKNVSGFLPIEATKDNYRCIAVDDSGNVYTTGCIQTMTDFDPGPDTFFLRPKNSVSQTFDAFISKLDADGNFVWAKLIEGTGDEKGSTVMCDHSGNVYTAGTFSSLTVDFDPGIGEYSITSQSYLLGHYGSFIQKLNSQGNFVWAHEIAGEYPCSFIIDEQENVYVAGEEITKFNSAGSIVWKKKFNGNPDSMYYGVEIGRINSNSYFVYSISPSSKIDRLVTQLDSSGNFILTQKGNFPKYPNGLSLVCDNSGYLFSLTSNYNPSYISIVKSKAMKSTDWGISLTGSEHSLDFWGNTRFNYGYSVSLDGEGNIYVLGKFTGTLDADPSDGVYMLEAPLGSLYLLKLRDVPLDVEEHNTPITFSVYPNPGTTTITAAFGKEVRNASVRITDLLGQVLVSQADVSGNSLQVDVSPFSPGMYVLELSDGGIVSRVKLVKE